MIQVSDTQVLVALIVQGASVLIALITAVVTITQIRANGRASVGHTAEIKSDVAGVKDETVAVKTIVNGHNDRLQARVAELEAEVAQYRTPPR